MSACGCAPQWQRPKLNGTCAACGGWLPGESSGGFFAGLVAGLLDDEPEAPDAPSTRSGGGS